VRVEAAVAFTLELRIRQMSWALVEDAVDEVPAGAARPSLPFLSWKRFLPFFASDMLVCMPLPFTPVTGLGRNDGRHAHLRGDLAREQLVELHLVGGDADLGVRVVHLELRGRDLGVILLVLEAHRALHLGRGVDEAAEGVARAASGSSRPR
jgi:hypothetical protein